MYKIYIERSCSKFFNMPLEDYKETVGAIASAVTIAQFFSGVYVHFKINLYFHLLFSRNL